jgi:hypothetical protein
MPPVAEELLMAMAVLAENHGLTHVVAKLDLEEIAPDGRTVLRNPYSVMFIPDLGWTIKDDLRTPSWSGARVIAHHRTWRDRFRQSATEET